MMKIVKHIFFLVLLMAPASVMAQVKIATVNVDAIFKAMPESARAQETLNTTSQQFKAEYELMQADFNRKYEAYQSMSASKDVPATIRDRRIREIQDGDRDIEAFLNKTKAQLEAQKRELEAPIYTKINNAIKTVGDARGFTYVFDTSKTPVVYTGAGAIDITADVKNLLGVQ